MAAFTFTMGGDDTYNHYTGWNGDTFRSAFTPSATGVNVNGGYVVTRDGTGAITAAVAATNKPIVITFMRQVFPTNSGSSARLEIDTASTGTAIYASSYRNCSGNEDVTPNYKMNAATTIWYGFRTNSSATIYFNQKATTGASDGITRYAVSSGDTVTWSTSQSLYARFDWYGVPAAPTSLAVTATTLSSVSLSWVAPTDTGGYTFLSGYRILYKKTSENDTAWLSTGKIGDNSTTSHTVTGLEIGTSYDFKLAATNAATDIYNATYSSLENTTGVNASITAATVSGGIWDGSGNWASPGVKVWYGLWVPAYINVWTGTEWKRQ